jgi:prophage tail gpP-like protein
MSANSSIGEAYDVVTITIGDSVVQVIESYTIEMAVLTQPSSFSLKLGHGSAVSELLAAAIPGTPFKLEIDGASQFQGRIDGVSASGRGDSGAEVTIRGRDHLAPLHDHHVTAAHSLSNITYLDLVLYGLKQAAPDFHGHLLTDDVANRKAVSKAPNISDVNQVADIAARAGNSDLFLFTATGKALVGQGVIGGVQGAAGSADAATATGTGQASAPSGSQRTIQAKIGHRWLEGIIKPELDRVGLALWAAGDGVNVILAVPDAQQPPIWSILNQRGETPNVTIESYDFHNDTHSRYSFCDVHFRGGGDGVEARTRGWGHAEDAEMIALGFKRALTKEDHKCKTLAQADFLAKRLIADANRHSWSLTYTVAGHTVIGTAGDRIVWSPNTTVDVQDDELDIHETLYIESVKFARGPQTTTELHLMRPADMLFGEPGGAEGG